MKRRDTHTLCGFPAHAGMDPGPSAIPSEDEGFPRPRGDGPSSSRWRSTTNRVSPPTRGWTLDGLHVRVCTRGFPAHAGMDPRNEALPRGNRWFPRPRGDGPHAMAACWVPLAVSPPTRGWTRSRNDGHAAYFGFPAHAGMDLVRRPEEPAAAGFPRPRGDGPLTTRSVRKALGVSPPTRGWTPLPGGPDPANDGFPAHAGMDHSTPPRAASPAGFPRPRGDGPQRTTTGCCSATVSPPTRGWTLWQPNQRHCLAGFPAHAGMDPRTRTPRKRCTRFPRPRGDGPLGHHDLAILAEVSPPTRGWTLGASTPPTAAVGFPAHAGMDPPPGSAPGSCIWFPRPRGDGPSCCRRIFTRPTVSPPTRGWTRDAFSHARL